MFVVVMGQVCPLMPNDRNGSKAVISDLPIFLSYSRIIVAASKRLLESSITGFTRPFPLSEARIWANRLRSQKRPEKAPFSMTFVTLRDREKASPSDSALRQFLLRLAPAGQQLR